MFVHALMLQFKFIFNVVFFLLFSYATSGAFFSKLLHEKLNKITHIYIYIYWSTIYVASDSSLQQNDDIKLQTFSTKFIDYNVWEQNFILITF